MFLVSYPPLSFFSLSLSALSTGAVFSVSGLPSPDEEQAITEPGFRE